MRVRACSVCGGHTRAATRLADDFKPMEWRALKSRDGVFATSPSFLTEGTSVQALGTGAVRRGFGVGRGRQGRL